MQTNEIQELLLDTIPAWHYWFARPFKRMLNDGVSLDMYYCIQSMRRSNRTMTMTELANFARMPKQQMSKLVDKLVEGGFAERLSDPDDRRVIRLRATEKADEYVASFLEKDAAEFRAFFDQLEGEERDAQGAVLRERLAHDLPLLIGDLVLERQDLCLGNVLQTGHGNKPPCHALP